MNLNRRVPNGLPGGVRGRKFYYFLLLDYNGFGEKDMEIDYYKNPFASKRMNVIARNGVVCTGNNLATQAGLRMLLQGGNAVDAAIATAACLTVVEPCSNGLGSDGFAIVWMKDKMYGMNSSGHSPYAISADQIDEIPKRGWIPVTVPGAVKGWKALSERFGSLPFKKLLEPAIDYAKNGYPVSAEIARMWKKALNAIPNSEEFKGWYETFTFDGKTPEPGQMICMPKLADALEKIADTNTDALYYGELASRIDEESRKFGGFLRKKDLEDHKVEWVDPIHVNYHGYQVWELPPNGQGIVALMALNILNNFQFKTRDVDCIHTQMEALKMAFADAKEYVTDPKCMEMPVRDLISVDYGKQRAKQIEYRALPPRKDKPHGSGTVYLCTADKDGNMVSYIQSNYMGFGSGIVVDGVSLQNRGYDFSLDPTHVNYLMPHKKTYHTIIPGFLTKDNKPIGPFGVMGGYMQPQGHMQIVTNMIDFHLNPQMALDAKRFQWIENKKFILEPGFDENIISELKKRGHEIEIEEELAMFGRGQIIVRLENGVYIAGCESRTDSNIACY